MRRLISGHKKYEAVLFILFLTLMACSHVSGVVGIKEDPQALAIITEDVANKIIGHYKKKGESLPPFISGPDGLRVAAPQYPEPNYLDKLKGIDLYFFSANGNNIVILACDPRTNEKIYEDTTSTTIIDLPAWQTSEREPCERTLGIE